MATATTTYIDSHAAATLRHIRSSMEAATAFAVPGSAGIAMGLVGLIAAILSLLPALATHWLTIWLYASLLAGPIGGVLVLRPASIQAFAPSDAPARKFALGLLPCLFVGAVVTAILMRHGDLDSIPGIWLLCYGCALITASVATDRIIGLMGATFALLGLAALLLPLTLQMLALGAGFGGLHLLFGVLISRRPREREI